MPFLYLDRDDKLKIYIGFLTMSLTVLTIFALSLDLRYASELRGMTLAFIAVAALLGIFYRASLRYWSAIVCGTVTSALTFLGGFGRLDWHDAPQVLGPVLSINLLLMLFAFRTPPWCYVILAAAIGTMVGISSGMAWAGLIAFLASVATLTVLNYMAQLVLDHRAELRLLPRSFRSHGMLGLAPRIILVWLPAAALALIGYCANHWAQLQIRNAAYETGLIYMDASSQLPISKRDVESDVAHTLKRTEDGYVVSFREKLLLASTRGEETLTSTPDATRRFMEEMQPTPIDAHAACGSAQTKILRKTISFRGMCRDIVNGINQSIQDAFARARIRIEESVSERVARGIVSQRELHDLLNEEGSREIRASFATFRDIARFSFLLASWLVLLNYLLLTVSLVAALQMIAGRILFDQNSTARPINPLPKANPTPQHQPLTFQLEQSGTARPIIFDQSNEMLLTWDAETGAGNHVWYIHLPVSRRGTGTHMNIRVPQPLSCAFQRILSGRYFFTRVDVRALATSLGSGPNAPRISVAGDTKLVRIQIQSDQRICFRMRDLVALTDGVYLSSIYSTYVGLHLLGLGSFYATAHGSGDLVLTTEGEQVSPSVQNQATPPASLLAWDHAQSFSLEQNIGIAGIWLNEPSLILSSPAGGAILDESGSDRFPLALRLWRLFRYLFMPV